jgi:anti-anti-sigma factor
VDSGKILVAEHKGVYSVKLLGDIRVTQCCEFYDYVQTILGSESYVDCLIDLSETEHMDSTTLGVLACVAKKARNVKPTIISPSESILRLLKSMSFDRVFSIANDVSCNSQDLCELGQKTCPDEEMRNRVIEAHKVLMGISDGNKATFSPLVDALEAEKLAS